MTSAFRSRGSVTLVDVSMRDGLQDEAVVLETGAKLEIATALVHSGLARIEATSFVHPKWVPQLADADDLVPLLPKGPRYSTLVLNMRGWERAVAAFERASIARGDYDLVFVTSASERHAMSNNNSTIEQTLTIFDELAAASTGAGISLRATIACAFVSPWPDESIAADRVASIAIRLAGGNVHTITLADTVGRADPYLVARRISEIQSVAPTVQLAMHMHDALGYGLANVYAGLESGIRIFEGALAGLGGCPFAPGAPGNQDIITLADFIDACGFHSAVNKAALHDASDVIRRALANASELSPSGSLK